MDTRALESPLPQSQPPPEEEHRRLPAWLGGRRVTAVFDLSPLNKRRWTNFVANRRGYWSLVVFLALFVVTLFAEFLSNDRPIVMSYKGEILWPVLVDYPESKFGGFLAVTDYKDPVILDEIAQNGWAIWPPIGYSYDTINKDYPGRRGLDKLCLGYPAPPPWASKAALCDAPAAQIEPGERTAEFRVGDDDLLVDGEGHSRVSIADYAVAFADEIESGANPRRRLCVAY